MSYAQSDYLDGFSFSGLTSAHASGVAGPFRINGGTYSFSCIDTGTADATLQMLMPDGSTYGALHAAYTSTTVGAVFQLPPCTIEVTLGTGTSLSACLLRVPQAP